ncbi:MAG: PepSY domain-containing protein, partial [Vicinamibacterales bacterium]
MRRLIFWFHLSAGVTAGLVILLMSVTGVLLTYERQMVAWADRSAAALPPAPDAVRMPVEQLLASVRAA